MFLLDTNAIIDILRARNDALLERYARTPKEQLAVCSVVKAELYFGAAKSAHPGKNRAVQNVFLTGLRSFEFDDAAAEHYAVIRAHLETSGQPIGANDLLISAIAVANSLTLVTHNTREMVKVPGLVFDDWKK